MKIADLPDGIIAVKWNARCRDENNCVECGILGDRIFHVDSDEFERLVPPPLHRECYCYLTLIDSSGREMK